METKIDEIRRKKRVIRNNVTDLFKSFSEKNINDNAIIIEKRLFEFANFLESKIVLLYINSVTEVPTRSIINMALNYNKIVVLPVFHKIDSKVLLMKIDDLDKDLVKGPKGIFQPCVDRCKLVPINCVEIAIIPGVSMDEKGGRIGLGDGYYDKVIPELPVTTRKVGLIFEKQIIPIVPMEAHDKYVDIVITEERIIYKI